MQFHPDMQYMNLVHDIRDNGHDKGDRTGTGTRSVFGRQMRFDLRGGKVPLLTGKKVFTRGIIHELIWMLSGDTNVRYLKEHGVSIWDSWVKPETAWYETLSLAERIKEMIRQQGHLVDFVNAFEDDMLPDDIETIVGSLAQDIPVNLASEVVSRFNQWLDNRGIPKQRLVAGELPKIYQHQWRQWEDTRTIDMDDWVNDDSYMEKGFRLIGEYYDRTAGKEVAVIRRHIDQIQQVIDQLRNNPDSRRIIVSAWNVADIDEMALPPCHSLFQFWTREMKFKDRKHWAEQNGIQVLPNGTPTNIPHYSAKMDELGIPTRALSCQLYQRSSDTPLGNPFNIVQYSLLTHLIGQVVNMVPEEFIWTGGDVHIYQNQWEALAEQETREPKEATARVVLNCEVTNIFDFTFDDIEIADYDPHPAVRFPAAAI